MMQPTTRAKPAKPFTTVEEAIEADRCWFKDHPEADEYIREFCPGEFGAMELPDIPPGFRYATLVRVIHRTDGIADGRHRCAIAVVSRSAANSWPR